MTNKNRDDFYFGPPPVQSELTNPQLFRQSQTLADQTTSRLFHRKQTENSSNFFDQSPEIPVGAWMNQHQPSSNPSQNHSKSREIPSRFITIFRNRWLRFTTFSFIFVLVLLLILRLSIPMIANIYAEDPIQLTQTPEKGFEPITIQELRKHNYLLVETFKKVEDARFNEHNGVDYEGLTRAIYHSTFKGKKEGGGTITMQVARNVVLGDLDQTLSRKLKEMGTAWNLEKKYSKDQILEAYLNGISFGNGIKGVQIAAKVYFGKNLKTEALTIGEVAVLAGLPKAPEGYNMYFKDPAESEKRRQKLDKRQATVLMLMSRKDDMLPLISEKEAKKWEDAPLPLQSEKKVKKALKKNKINLI
ncbi:biosynthetic peptidoglycan transglycosylase [Thermoflavimicrobium daqui]|uniref:Glycosyl transferase family 51 domain-containing protein n=1 Tax=Thermoflavimicrobium daqui TaxID=2137476 RepID=A0A364K1D3_9BACL|nr:biosynthetic peptidoglycan transglycosylase [Thermoflavimicrobium daqui]RAL21842.1 hypothetical protein DL897_15610 [Thermoflavimicrobium daqui]